MPLYDDLGLKPDATEAEIKAAHRKAVKKHHPDNGGDEDAFHKVQHAYRVLVDPRRRARYDESGDDGSDPSGLEDSEVMNLVASAVLAAMGQTLNFETVNLLSIAQQALTKKVAELVKGKREAKRAIDQMERVKKRFNLRAKGGPDMIADLFEGQKRGIQSSIAVAERNERIVERALAVLAGYEYRVEAGGGVPDFFNTAATYDTF